jgi:hypothetical protein
LQTKRDGHKSRIEHLQLHAAGIFIDRATSPCSCSTSVPL